MGAPSTEDFQFVGGSLALDLVNTVGNRLSNLRDDLRAKVSRHDHRHVGGPEAADHTNLQADRGRR